jgi:hypothetical protein
LSGAGQDRVVAGQFLRYGGDQWGVRRGTGTKGVDGRLVPDRRPRAFSAHILETDTQCGRLPTSKTGRTRKRKPAYKPGPGRRGGLAQSVALAGFGLDSLIEIGASTVVIWELSGTGQARQLLVVAGSSSSMRTRTRLAVSR